MRYVEARVVRVSPTRDVQERASRASLMLARMLVAVARRRRSAASAALQVQRFLSFLKSGLGRQPHLQNRRRVHEQSRLVAPTTATAIPATAQSTLNNGANPASRSEPGSNVSKNKLTTAAGFVDDTWRLNVPDDSSASAMRLIATSRFFPSSRDLQARRSRRSTPVPDVQQLGPTRGHER